MLTLAMMDWLHALALAVFANNACWPPRLAAKEGVYVDMSGRADRSKRNCGDPHELTRVRHVVTGFGK